MRTIRPPECKRTTTLQVAVKCRPLTAAEKNKCKEIVRILDEKVVLVTDADGSRQREKRYAFDYAFGPELKNRDVYNRTVASMVTGVVQGLNATIFAYGATGSGKTYTMAGTAEDPGLMVLSLQDIFELVSKEEREHEFEITCSYLEVYNEVIYDLLEKSSGHLELREDPEQGIVVAGLKRIQVNSAAKILELLHIGNSRRKTEKTDANSTSSRSHAVLEIIVKKYCRNALGTQVLQGKVALVDLAGSERASETNNAGQKLRDGANINKSLLALANCINALGKKQKKGLAYVPYRNSKLTRILKDGLSGNSQTCMIATVSYADHQYQHTISTLKYADRAKEIKTHVQKNIGTLDSHVADYQRMINNLQDEVSSLRKELEEKEVQLNGLSIGKAQDDGLSWLDTLSRDIKENVEERINLQKALFELEDKNMHNHNELQQLDDEIARHHMDDDAVIVETLVERRKLVLDNIRDNDEAGAQYRQEIEQNEGQRKDLQDVIEKALSSNNSATYLRILSQYRLLGMSNTELQLQIAVRDQIINNQREVLSNLWTVLRASGLEQKQILELASRQGITIEGWAMSSPMTCNAHKTGYPLLHELPTSNTCETCNALGLLQFTSVTSRYHEYSNTNRTMYHTISRNNHNSYPNCRQQGLYAHGMEKNSVAGNFLHASMLSSACGHTNGAFRMPVHCQERGFLGREACKACLDAKRGTGMFNAPQNNMFAEAFSSMKMDSHADAKRHAVGSACCSSGTPACESQLKHRSHSSEMRQLDCCSDKCKASGAHNIRVDDYEIVRIRSHQQSRLTKSLSHCCGCG